METPSIFFGSQYKFPLKLYQVVNDGLLIKWTDDGMAIVVEQKEFEENVMQLYPGFVQVKTFHNLRRLFRDYSFKFRMLRRRKPYGYKIEFRHQQFKRDSPQEIRFVRKNKHRYFLYPLASSSPINKTYVFGELSSKLKLKRNASDGNYLVERDGMHCRRKILSEFNAVNCASSSTELTLNSKDIMERFYIGKKLTFYNTEPANCFSLEACDRLTTKREALSKEVMSILEHTFAKNELSEPEFWEFLARKSGSEWKDKSWEAAVELIDKAAIPELSPLHHNSSYYELSFEEL